MVAFSDTRDFYVLIKPWRILSDRGLTGSFVAVFALAIFNECLKYYNAYRTYNPLQTNRNAITTNERMRFLATATSSYMVQNTLSFFIMLVAMTYNVWLFVAIVLGQSAAYLVFVPLLERYMYKKYRKNMLNRHYEPVTAT
ncbi:copper transport protein CTR2-like [Actinia tenebrosa]|uniref:Copper transport protein n=1 Tax=Actinia tenebrosa TaxID=6105 RepID=A0A6P8IU19_ACTTE|nr:copper transport protein CTR2-like [Actinia tenebrosa]